MTDSQEGPVLFFDGVCNLCTGAVKFIIRHDKKKRFRFASLQSNAGLKAIQEIEAVVGKVPDSLILLHNGKYYWKSDAALRTVGLSSGWLSILQVFMIVPRFIRDSVYDLVARKRYMWFGRKDKCMLPTAELKSRFLD